MHFYDQVKLLICFLEKNKGRMGRETKKRKGRRRIERKEEREAGELDRDSISSVVVSQDNQ